MRSFTHHSFREAPTFRTRPANNLVTDPSVWQRKHFDPTTDHYLRRRDFARTG